MYSRITTIRDACCDGGDRDGGCGCGCGARDVRDGFLARRHRVPCRQQEGPLEVYSYIQLCWRKFPSVSKESGNNDWV